jgi:hypothetical protein
VAVSQSDLAILKFCLEQKFLTLLQVSKQFFPWNRKILNWPMKCVRKLVRRGLLKSERPAFCDKALYWVTPAGAKVLRRHGMSNGLKAISEIDTRTWEHDLCVTDVRLVFEKVIGIQDWVCERSLKQEKVKAKVPDGLATYRGKRLVIEVELNLKKKKYYEKTLKNTCIWDYPKETVLYMAANETDKKWLIKQAGGWSQIYVGILQEFIDIQDLVEFENADGKKFTIFSEYQGGVYFKASEELEDDEEDEIENASEDEDTSFEDNVDPLSA